MMDTDEDMRTMIKLKAADNNEVFEISLKAAQISNMIVNSYEQNDDDDDDGAIDAKPLEFPKISGGCLKKVVEFMKYHDEKEKFKDIPFPFPNQSLREFLKETPWYSNFVSKENLGEGELGKRMLFQLVTAADYLDIKPLLNLTTYKMFSDMNGKSFKEMSDYLGLESETESPDSSMDSARQRKRTRTES